MGQLHWGGLWRETVGPLSHPSEKMVEEILRPKDFNDIYVKCVGKHVTIRLNGVTKFDREFPLLQDEGVIGGRKRGAHDTLCSHAALR